MDKKVAQLQQEASMKKVASEIIVEEVVVKVKRSMNFLRISRYINIL